MTTIHDLDMPVEAAIRAALNGYPALDLHLLRMLVAWAEQDEAFADKFAEWGAWSQSTYGIEIERANIAVGMYDKVALNKVTWAGNECGSAYCIAGQTVIQRGYRMDYGPDSACGFGGGPESDITLYGRSADRCVMQQPSGEKDCKGRDIMVDVPGAYSQPIHEVARQQLGLTDIEAGVLFDGDNDVYMLKGLINGFCEARGLYDMFPGVSAIDPDDVCR